MTKLYLYIVIYVVAICIGCSKDWFDVKSDKQLAVPVTLKDFQALLDNGRLFNTFCPEMGENASDYHGFRDNILSMLSVNEMNSYTWSRIKPFRNVSDWANGTTGSYGKVYNANLVLEGVRKLTNLSGSELAQRNSIEGQALFLRSKTFFELAEVFSPAYDVSIKQQRLGIPLRMESDILLKSERSTIEQTYSTIINDLLSASALLPDMPSFKTRASKVSCFAMLARVYLSMRNYSEALKYANAALEKYNTLINYSDLAYEGKDNPFVDYVPEVIFYSYINGVAFTPRFVDVDINLYKSYNENDLRKFALYNYDELEQRVTFKGSYSGRGFNYFFNGLATDELYLVRAECNVRNGNVNSAMNDINTLLKSRWKGLYMEISASNTEEALNIVLEERKKELVFRGVRWSDLRRLNREPQFAQTFTRIVNGKTYTLEPNSYQYTFPIPEDIIEVSGMQQNPGW
ncbi:RagB/SusD family nutrient uptake outer membrane protein [Chitinophaga caseinilytica]|uniref:RagB/SusD family nutrient uptake outer membrane protein n=1 Tax=Chitinophaga caseinilytica TaxID=2267521 RepID=UPI003C2DC50F